VLLSAAMFEPTYCAWLCPFKAVTEFAEVNSLETAVQTGIFLTLFVGLVVVLPVLTKKRTQCAFFCPFGAFQSLFNKVNVFDIRIDRGRCGDCVSCRRSCPTMALDKQSVEAGGTLLSCMRCGACVDVSSWPPSWFRSCCSTCSPEGWRPPGSAWTRRTAGGTRCEPTTRAATGWWSISRCGAAGRWSAGTPSCSSPGGRSARGCYAADSARRAHDRGGQAVAVLPDCPGQ